MTPENKIKSTWKPSDEELSFIMAMSLGDGSLTNTGRFVVAHGLKQKDYCEWKADRLSKILKQEIKALPSRHLVQTQVQRKVLKDYYFKVYPNRQKSLSTILSYTNNPEETVAIWICDDGNVSPSIARNGKCYSASFQIFTFCSLEDGQGIVSWFKSELDVEAKLHFRDRSKDNKKSAYIIKFSASESRKLYGKIKPYIPDIPSMKYKFRYIEYNSPKSPQGSIIDFGVIKS